jgi:tRNA 5-methylaminomethyl-2-thiouridine biosynthesis bifunctional protein
MSSLPDDTRRLLPPFPVNGHGALVHSVPGPDGEPSWVLGSTFERGMAEAVIRSDDRAANLAKLQTLLPRVGQAMAPHVTQGNDWAGVRCTLPDRLPAVGYLDPVALPGLALCTGLGARGLTLSVLCGEWLAALLDGEPWPTERVLADKLSAQRWRSSAA